MTVPFTFHASVADDAISKVSRLFNATLDDIFAELFQNARRAGASKIAVDQLEDPELGTVIRIVDDGAGLTDPKHLFLLGQSAWPGQVTSVEDAAGMGFFALAGRHVRITVQQKGTNQSWVVAATPDSFTGTAPISCSEGPVGHKGMTILISAKKGENFIPAANHAAQYLPLEVVVDDTLADRKDFLANADYIEDWNGIRIGIYSNPQNHFRNDMNVNFHGVTLYAKLPSLGQQFHRSYYARLDVTRCTSLKLVLPARKEVVEDTFFDELRNHIRTLFFQRILAAGSHSLSFEAFTEAAALGVDLAPAVMMLRPFSPTHANTDCDQQLPLQMVDSDDILFDSNGGAIEKQNLAYALSSQRAPSTLYTPNPAFRGYAWYDQLACLCVKHYVFIGEDHTKIILPEKQYETVERPVRLEIHCEIGSNEGVDDWQCETDWLIFGEDFVTLDEVDIVVTKCSQATSADLVDFLEKALFCPSDDAEAGLYDQQRDWFRDETEDRIITLLQTSAEADINAVIRIVDRELYWLSGKSDSVTIHIENGRVEVVGLDDVSVAAE